jgi:hypothetical protein
MWSKVCLSGSVLIRCLYGIEGMGRRGGAVEMRSYIIVGVKLGISVLRDRFSLVRRTDCKRLILSNPVGASVESIL